MKNKLVAENPEFDHDERYIAEAIRDARHIQEFIWSDESASQKAFDPEV